MPRLKIINEFKGAMAAVKAGKRAVNKILRDTFLLAGKFHKKNLLPKHFLPRGAKEYGYDLRSGEQSGLGRLWFRTYMGRKQREKRHKLPLVHSGRTFRATQDANVKARAPGGIAYFEVTAQTPALNFRPAPRTVPGTAGPAPDMLRELESFSSEDEDTLDEIIEKEIERAYTRFPQIIRERIG